MITTNPQEAYDKQELINARSFSNIAIKIFAVLSVTGYFDSPPRIRVLSNHLCLGMLMFSIIIIKVSNSNRSTISSQKLKYMKQDDN